MTPALVLGEHSLALAFANGANDNSKGLAALVAAAAACAATRAG